MLGMHVRAEDLRHGDLLADGRRVISWGALGQDLILIQFAINGAIDREKISRSREFLLMSRNEGLAGSLEGRLEELINASLQAGNDELAKQRWQRDTAELRQLFGSLQAIARDLARGGSPSAPDLSTADGMLCALCEAGLPADAKPGTDLDSHLATCAYRRAREISKEPGNERVETLLTRLSGVSDTDVGRLLLDRAASEIRLLISAHEQLVKDLASHSTDVFDADGVSCVLCSAQLPTLMESLPPPEAHEPSCPYRRANELLGRRR
jgi:hypothetical protein